MTSQADFDQWVVKVGKSPDKLGASTYAALARPSENEPVRYYSTVAPDLFDSIVDKYMGMPMDKPMSIKTGVDSDAPGAINVR